MWEDDGKSTKMVSMITAMRKGDMVQMEGMKRQWNAKNDLG